MTQGANGCLLAVALSWELLSLTSMFNADFGLFVIIRASIPLHVFSKF